MYIQSQLKVFLPFPSSKLHKQNLKLNYRQIWFQQGTQFLIRSKIQVLNLFIKIQPLKLSHNKHTSEISVIHSLPNFKMSEILAVSYTNHYIGHRPILNNPTRTLSPSLFIPLLNC